MSDKPINLDARRLRWVIWLLATAVILPTVCLLWFMNLAVQNERLAVQQKLIDNYTQRADYFFKEVTDLYFDNLIPGLTGEQEMGPGALFCAFAASPDSPLEGMLIYDSSGILEYPVLDRFAYDLPEELKDAFQAEQAGDYGQAVEQYKNIAEEAAGPALRGRAELARARCLVKLGRLQEAAELANKMQPMADDPETALIRAHAGIFLAQLYRDTKDPELVNCLRTILADNRPAVMPVETAAWQLDKLVKIARQENLAETLRTEITDAENRIRAYQNSAAAAALYPDLRALESWPDRTVRRLSPQSNLYGLKYTRGSYTILGMASADKMLSILHAAVKDMEDDIVVVRVLDNTGQLVAGQPETAQIPFWTSPPGRFFPEFGASLYFTGDFVFQAAAERKAALYIWAAVLVIAFLFFSGTLAVRTVGKQMRLNRLKNDFIATVTHELKTPLSSTRLLVDTLLENNCQDPRQTREYLELIAKENHRLSRLIDNFLTFSRMERNKQAFEFTQADPARIARTAADAVQTKFSEADCRFALDVPDNLPQIRIDKDAMVTVLVNLLDNAFKYSGSSKQIKLSVFTEGQELCFSVQDNGIGIGLRDRKKIFERFYQVDRSLARGTEGTGLGLSIVKFIVDAHRGRITVESKVGGGSCFTVCLPLETKGQD